MAEMLDCLVSYFCRETSEEGMPRRYFSYHIVAGPGPTDSGGVATITVLATVNDQAFCESCDRFHAVKTGGPRAAIDRAVRHLDAWHEGENLRKVQTDIRRNSCADQSFGLPEVGDQTGEATPPRIEAADLKSLLESGQPVTVLDARSPEAWNAARLKIRGDVRIERDRYRVDPSLPRDRLTVVYCTCPREAGAAEVAGRLLGRGFIRMSV